MDLSRIRNLGLMAHMDAGKTTTTERILALAAAQVEGSPTEGEGGEEVLSITSAATSCTWRDHEITIIDTPGQADFALDVERALRVLDGAVALFSGVDGVQAQSETFWRQADTYHVPRLAFVNKMDRPGADFNRVVDEIRLRLNAQAVPVQVPVLEQGDLVGLIDVVEMAYVRFAHPADVRGPIPAALEDAAQAAREALLDAIVEYDEAIGDRVVANDDIPADVLRAAIRNAVIRFGLVPVLAGSAFRARGMAQLLDAVIDWMPSPSDVPAVEGRDPDDRERILVRDADPAEPFSALAFRVVTDHERGSLLFLRIYSGSLRVGDEILNTTSGARERVLALTRIRATLRRSLDAAGAGCIVGVTGLVQTSVGDTLCATDKPIAFTSLDVPPPVVGVEVEVPAAEADALARGVEALSQRDPGLRVRGPFGPRVILEGLSDAHLQVLVGRLRREMGLDATVSERRVAFRETPLRAAEAQATVGHTLAILRVEPAERGEGLTILNPAGLPGLSGLDRALRRALELGGPHGHPVVDVCVTITLAHDGVGREDAVEAACRQAIERAGTCVLEPVMMMEVVSPEEHLGAILDATTGMRGHVKRIESRGTIRALAAHVPLSELAGFSERLSALSGGRANASIQFAHYERVPLDLADALAAAR